MWSFLVHCYWVALLFTKGCIGATENSTHLGHRKKQCPKLKHIQQLSNFLLFLDKSTINVHTQEKQLVFDLPLQLSNDFMSYQVVFPLGATCYHSWFLLSHHPAIYPPLGKARIHTKISLFKYSTAPSPIKFSCSSFLIATFLTLIGTDPTVSHQPSLPLSLSPLLTGPAWIS